MQLTVKGKAGKTKDREQWETYGWGESLSALFSLLEVEEFSKSKLSTLKLSQFFSRALERDLQTDLYKHNSTHFFTALMICIKEICSSSFPNLLYPLQDNILMFCTGYEDKWMSGPLCMYTNLCKMQESWCRAAKSC